MPTVTQNDITAYVQAHIPDFHRAKLESLKALPLTKVLSRKNPYLLKAKALVTPRDLVKAILDAHLSSQEETILGNFLEGLAIFICKGAYRAHGKSTTTGLDLEFDKDGRRYLVTIKSGPNWGNSGQVAKMRADFKTAVRVYRQNRDAKPVVCVNGCCYGRQPLISEDKGDYLKLCGQRFWEFISGDAELYIKIVEPIGHKATERNAEFLAQYELVLDSFTETFRQTFCDAKNNIQWDKLVEISCQAPPPRAKRR